MIAGAENMSWRGKYISWYRLAEEVLGKLVPTLSDQEIMENVAPEDELIALTVYDNQPRNKKRNTPHLWIKLSDTGIKLGILYAEQEQLKLLKNIFRETYTNDLGDLLESIRGLDPSYETILYCKTRDEKPTLIRKYVSARLDKQLLERIIEESEWLRRGGRQMQNNQSMYISPKTSELFLIRVAVPLKEPDYRIALQTIKPIFSIVSRIKTHRELISERLSQPRIKRNLYRDFIEALNEVRSRGLISAERRREINQQWRDDEDRREELLETLKELLNPRE
jgi:hypothetical protein